MRWTKQAFWGNHITNITKRIAATFFGSLRTVTVVKRVDAPRTPNPIARQSHFKPNQVRVIAHFQKKYASTIIFIKRSFKLNFLPRKLNCS